MNNSNSSADTTKLDSELLRTFLAVAESGSFSLAADRIFRSQSAVSLQIKQLESILGQAVFRRHARGVVLTPAGETLLPTAQKVVALLQAAIGELRLNPLQGAIRIGIPDEYGAGLLAGVIARFSRDHPQVEIQVLCSFSAKFPEALANNEIDMAVHSVAKPDKQMHRLRREKTVWVTSKNHAAHLQQPLPLALFDRACWWREDTLAALDKAGIAHRIVFSSESVTGISAAVAAGVAVAVLGDKSLSEDFRVLTPQEGFPQLADSTLVLQSRAGIDKAISEAMSSAIKSAFN